ncbi:MAG: FAD-binding oxidoreductase [Acidobacteria bacterium]|nr:FAD-binding oxidoreductase [Acidobacteriota bacterium]
MAEQGWISRVEQIVGLENVTASEQADALRARGWEGPLPKVMVSPGSREQICELLRLASAERLSVAPAGGMTKQGIGGTPQKIDLVLSLSRMNRVTDYPAADLTVSVEAGVSLQELEATLRAQGQMLPLDAPYAAEGTVGGVLATNGSGPRRLAYGSARDMVLGVHFVTAEGKLAKSGGKVVKNVAGYDMTKLLIGSFGTLAILTDVTFRVYPIPPASVTLAAGFESLEQAMQARDNILRSPFAPQAMDLLDAAAVESLGEAAVGSAAFLLLVRVAGPEKVIERGRRELPDLTGAHGAVWLEGEHETKLWEKVQEFTPSFLSGRPDGAVVKVSALLGQVGKAMETARRAAAENDLQSAALARAGTGIVYCYLWPRSGDNGSCGERLARTCAGIIQEAERAGGRAVVEWAPPEVKQRANIWGTLGDDFAVIRRLKMAWDPQGILNPGRGYGGI